MTEEQMTMFKQMFENALQLPEKEQLTLFEAMAQNAKTFLETNKDFTITPEMLEMFSRLSPQVQERVKEFLAPYINK
ncbi:MULTISPECIES: hypothetical protein [Aneurinibacillus]|jgi:triphosphoribosyl-dephospho-CoA synthetase|uniref:Uncharacterized protein n=1 Tax=Aneurinibacillus thermoaerophilus TaxID=143495 RepID=A0A1G8DGX1_ANETH|nr:MULTISPECIES: hypothetical protein [Aneurinibacillus]AMA74345.1 hypothetical protein ACH33_17025 [Aneurinibacillus sp. XH2]MED0674187.1 hypothetical protein [Aneurinibacillus thermoaerophilus]MED0678750.1 hypothetical protein [Aneurinibacillus thermoaerophilus]MED0736740.1 hypothetical protein [Aneurinibacillus thermoaerophilus]MED0758287.1 hypothetical protein [Aneurinibacillus thermoaerophilus]